MAAKRRSRSWNTLMMPTAPSSAKTISSGLLLLALGWRVSSWTLTRMQPLRRLEQLYELACSQHLPQSKARQRNGKSNSPTSSASCSDWISCPRETMVGDVPGSTRQPPPAVTLREPFPPDLMEDATRHQTLVNAELESIEEAIYEMRPDWSSDRRVLEVQRIFANRDGYALDDDGNPVTAQIAPGPASTTGSETPSSGDGTPTGGGASPSPRPPGTTATPAP